jgi:hypothetical protein
MSAAGAITAPVPLPVGQMRPIRRAVRPAPRRSATAVIGVNVTFEYDDGYLDRARVIEIAENNRGMFEGMPGLRFKFFTIDEKHHRATNFYVWDSPDAAEVFFSEERRGRIAGLYGVAPTIDFVQIVEIVDNSGA